jgi:hypothetical protein
MRAAYTTTNSPFLHVKRSTGAGVYLAMHLIQFSQSHKVF